MSAFGNLASDAGLSTLNAHLTSRSYVEGYSAGTGDVETFALVSNNVDASKFPHVARWWNHLASFTSQQRRSVRPSGKVVLGEAKEEKKAPAGKKAPEAKEETKKAPAKAAAEDDEMPDDMDFDSLGESSAADTAEVEKIMKQKADEAAQAKTDKKKSGPIPKSNVILDVKPEDDETDMKDLEAKVRAITKEGLMWAGSQLEPIAFGLKKLRIIAIVHDDVVSVDELQEEIEKLPGVQSTDIHAFNKV